ncbi:MAG: ribonuclease J [Candidatus Pacebacteria bacterium]|nr:ribonuclease J [Candidatus Paceibacterota bacterium]
MYKEKTSFTRNSDQKKDDSGKLRIVPLGGLGEVGRNMTIIEWEDKAIIIDIGLSFPEERTPGVDYVIPNISYLEKRNLKILGILITHGHYDHIGAIPYIMEKIGNPPIFGSPLALGITKRRQEEFPLKPKLQLNEVEDGSKVELHPFSIEFFHQNHNIPQNLGICIKTPVGNIVHTSDFKFDPTPTNAPPSNFKKLNEIASRGVLFLMSDSTGAEQEGHSLSEKTISENLEQIFKKSSGRIITATFASLINRVQDIIYFAEKYDRKVVIEGYGMKTNIEISRNLGIIKVKKGTIIPSEKASLYQDHQLALIITGAQGEDEAALMRILSGQHRFFKLKKGDSVVLSSSVIPGNERSVQNVKDNIMRQGASIFHYQMMDIHAGGHAQEEELVEMLRIMKPKFFMPIHGQYSMMANHAKIARREGIPRNHIALTDNGHIIKVDQETMTLSKKPVMVRPVMVEGSGVGNIGGVVLRDRIELSESGIFVVITAIDKKTRKVKNSPDIISRGFVYLRESQVLLTEARKKIREVIFESVKTKKDIKAVKKEIKTKIERLLYKKTGKKPLVLPVIIEVD